MSDSNHNEPYRITLCMAGAVSAGSYTAGAMHELFRALRLWHSGRSLPAAPSHSVKIAGFSGASAGSIQSVLSILEALSDDQNQNLSLATWKQITLEMLLNNKDLDDGNLKSLLNSEELRKTATNVVNQFEWSTSWPTWLSDPLPVRLSVTNLRGIPYDVRLPEGHPVAFGMNNHREALTYTFSYQETPNQQKSGKEALHNLMNGALASSAFPVAFAPVKTTRTTCDGDDDENIYDVKKWLNGQSAINDGDKLDVSFITHLIEPTWNDSFGTPNEFFSVDGGATDNEPLMEAFKILLGDEPMDWLDQKKQGKVLFIDPFPNQVDNDIKESDLRLDKSLLTLLNTLVDQSRFSEDLLTTSNLRSRVGLVYPSNPNSPNKETPIQSAALGGFAGFLKPEFMDHDFKLGSLNMRRFLRYHFVLPANDLLFSKWKDKEKWLINAGEHGKEIDCLPIIPTYIENENENENNETSSLEIFNCSEEEKNKYYEPTKEKWTRFNTTDSDKLNTLFAERFDKIGIMLFDTHAGLNNETDNRKLNALQKLWRYFKKRSIIFFMKLGWKSFGKNFLAAAVVRTVENQLKENEMFEEEEN